MNIEQFNYSVDLFPAILWQYDEAVILNTLIAEKQIWYADNQTDFWETFFTNIFSVLQVPAADLIDPDTIVINSFGLAVWAIILGIPLQIGIPETPYGTPIFGFDWVDSTWTGNLNFARANFSNGSTQPFLTLDQQQLILKLRYFQLTMRASIPNINAFIGSAFQGVTGFTGQVYVLDTYAMVLEYIFTGSLSASLKQILIEYDILPRPAGVGIKIYSNINEIWGFGPYYQNFNNGCFIGS